MLLRFRIFTLLLFACFFSYGQISFPTKGFHRHIQTCHYVGTTEEDFTIVLYNDSVIKVSKYASNYIDQYSSVTRQVYIGRYVINGDTLVAKFSDHNSDMKSNNKKIGLKPSIKNFQFPPTTYIINKKSVAPLENLFPVVFSMTVSDIISIETKFENWDKNIANNREIFGLPKN